MKVSEQCRTSTVCRFQDGWLHVIWKWDKGRCAWEMGIWDKGGVDGGKSAVVRLIACTAPSKASRLLEINA